MSNISDFLFRIFEEKMVVVCGTAPSGHAKSMVSEKWFNYIDSLKPYVETVRPTIEWDRGIVPRKKGNFPALDLLARRINEGEFDRIVIEDPGQASNHVVAWGPNLLLVDRQFALKVYALGELP